MLKQPHLAALLKTGFLLMATKSNWFNVCSLVAFISSSLVFINLSYSVSAFFLLVIGGETDLGV